MKIYVVPADGLVVLKPDGARMANDGEWVDYDTFWLRRLADGDVERRTPPGAEGGQ